MRIQEIASEKNVAAFKSKPSEAERKKRKKGREKGGRVLHVHVTSCGPKGTRGCSGGEAAHIRQYLLESESNYFEGPGVSQHGDNAISPW